MGRSRMSVINNPAAYRKRCEPRSQDDANQALEDFYVGVYELANKHGIADVMLVTQVCIRINPNPLDLESERETFASSSMHIGSEAHALELAAYAHAYHRAELEQRLGSIKSNAEKRARG